MRFRPAGPPRRPSRLGTAWLVLVLLSPAAAEAQSQVAATELPLGASALDAWSVLADAERRTYQLNPDGVDTFTCRVDSELFAAIGRAAGLTGEPPAFQLWWARPGVVRAVPEGGTTQLTRADADQLVALVLPLHELLLPRPAFRRLSGHAFRFGSPPVSGDGTSTVVIAEARSANEDRRRATFTIDAEGLVVGERTETADGAVSDLRYRHERRGRWNLLVASAGTYRGREVGVAIEWGAIVGGRPVATSVRVHQRDEVGRTLPGGVGDVTFRLSGHAFNPGWPFEEPGQPPDAPDPAQP